MATRFNSVVSRLVRLGKRGVAVALVSVLLTSAAVPPSAFADHAQHIAHTADDGQGDSPQVP